MSKIVVGAASMLVVALGVVYGVLYMGLIPVGADNRPGYLERRFTHMATDAYVTRNAPKQENPFPPTSANLLEGARRYEEHCALCHGGAATRVSPLRYRFSPPAPQLVNRVPRDPDAHLWWITKHGFRLTGMPAWDGLLSDDEIWKVVLFMKSSDKLPAEVEAAWRAAAAAPCLAENAGARRVP